jgi:hypothetical protein
VRTLTQQYHPGTAILWDMTDENGRPVKRGAYKYRFAVEYKTGRFWEERGAVPVGLQNQRRARNRSAHAHARRVGGRRARSGTGPRRGAGAVRE